MEKMMGHKLVKAAAARLAPRGGTASTRPDLYLSDHQRIANDASHALVGWAPTLEDPTPEAIQHWVMATFETGNVLMDLNSLKFHKPERVASFVVRLRVPTRQIDDAKTMAHIAPNKLLEANTQTVWEVRETEKGDKYLACLVEDNLDELLAEKHRKVRKAGALSFHSVRSAGLHALNAGDKVRFYDKGLLKEGTVSSLLDGEVTVKNGKDTMLRIAFSAVTEVVQKDPATIQDYSQRVWDYYAQIFPKEYMERWKGAADRTHSSDRAGAAKTGTFPCPECGTKVLQNTKYCLKCKKKVEPKG